MNKIFSESAVLCNEWDSSCDSPTETAIKNQIDFNYIFMLVCLGQDYQVLGRLCHRRNTYAIQIYYNAFRCFSKGQALLNIEVFVDTERTASGETSLSQD